MYLKNQWLAAAYYHRTRLQSQKKHPRWKSKEEAKAGSKTKEHKNSAQLSVIFYSCYYYFPGLGHLGIQHYAKQTERHLV